MFLMLALIIALAVLGPLFGADSRDGLDHAPDHFWRRRPFRPSRTGSPSSTASAPASARPRAPAARDQGLVGPVRL
ncbi:hypothetical protein ACFHW2_12990 [Actinomadura sp. LOL_016]|uniref:hypothetical protein n=1 Tax=unclassified Actinomadura TaxID=2626254 RepID=UPI003A80C1F2